MSGRSGVMQGGQNESGWVGIGESLTVWVSNTCPTCLTISVGTLPETFPSITLPCLRSTGIVLSFYCKLHRLVLNEGGMTFVYFWQAGPCGLATYITMPTLVSFPIIPHSYHILTSFNVHAYSSLSSSFFFYFFVNPSKLYPPPFPSLLLVPLSPYMFPFFF